VAASTAVRAAVRPTAPQARQQRGPLGPAAVVRGSGLHSPRCAPRGGHRPPGRAPSTTPVQKWYRLDVVADSFELVLLDPPPVPTRRTFGHRDTVPAIPLLLPPSDNWRGKDKGWEREYGEMHRPLPNARFALRVV
jgi:hypothetical protein